MRGAVSGFRTMIRHEIEKLVEDAIRAAQEAGQIPAVGAPDPLVERAQRAEHGDYASSLPLRLARTARMNPMELAGVIAGHVVSGGAIESVETAPPGFINIRLSSQWLVSQVDEILKQGETFGDVSVGQGKRVQVEFVLSLIHIPSPRDCS
jgi:arginyl-tRNA synthetase